MIVFLQNAWSPTYAGRHWPRRSWLVALERSRSGKRLRVMLDDLTVCHNTTPVVGASPSSKPPADTEHIADVLRQTTPGIVVVCGVQAEEAVAPLWDGPLLAVPHPAHRLLTDALYRRARRMLRDGVTNRVALRQDRGRTRIEEVA